MSAARDRRRSWLVPEVIQTSQMDCGPAALKAVLQGFGIPVHYEALRERCQTDVDGTSMDALVALGRQLGLETTHIVTPRDSFLLPEADCLPGIVVTRSPGGAFHFIVVWGTVGPFVQIMDPGGGRRWVGKREFLETIPNVPTPISSERFRQWAASEDSLRPLRVKMRALGVSARSGGALVALASDDPTHYGHAALDAAVRMVATFVKTGAVSRGGQASRLLDEVARASLDGSRPGIGKVIPKGFWWALPARAPGKVSVSGVMIVHFARQPSGADAAVTRRLSHGHAEDEGARAAPVHYRESARAPHAAEVPGHPFPHADSPGAALSPALGEDLFDANASPLALFWKMVRFDAPFALGTVVVALTLSAAVAMIDAVVLRELFDVAHNLSLTYQRIVGIASMLVFVGGALLLDSFVTRAVQRVGRGLEMRLRVGFLEKLPKLEDRYLRSRPTSDMAARGHAMHALRDAPSLGARMARSIFSFVATIAGIVWLYPAGAALAVGAALVGLLVPYALRKPLAESTMRLRTHTSALDRFYLDALLGVMPIRAHGAERAVRREHEALLVEWAGTARAVYSQNTLVQTLQSFASTAIVAGIVANYILSGGPVNGLLLLVFWALRIPAIGQELIAALIGYRNTRNVAMRLFAPLAAPEVAASAPAPALAAGAARTGVHLALRNVTVRATGHTLLRRVSLEIPAGSHVAIVGASGAGKSSLVSLLLGWLGASEGEVLADGERLDEARLARLRSETAWVDPAIFLFNRSLLDNVVFGEKDGPLRRLPDAIAGADLADVLEGLPEGLQAELGEGGARVSGGQGQRVRMARAFMRTEARLVILDEPFRGLERPRRRELLRRVRAHWPRATILFVSHDVGDTLDLDRVLVIDDGAVVEDGAPRVLARDVTSRYRALAMADRALYRELWAHAGWRRMRMDRGRLVESPPEAA